MPFFLFILILNVFQFNIFILLMYFSQGQHMGAGFYNYALIAKSLFFLDFPIGTAIKK